MRVIHVPHLAYPTVRMAHPNISQVNSSDTLKHVFNIDGRYKNT